MRALPSFFFSAFDSIDKINVQQSNQSCVIRSNQFIRQGDLLSSWINPGPPQHFLSFSCARKGEMKLDRTLDPRGDSGVSAASDYN